MASTPDIIQNYERLFADRYTLEDKEYQKSVQCPPDTPPIVEDWLNREPRVPSALEILQNYERMFAHRFTSEDEEYQKYVQRSADTPPLVEDWRIRSGDSEMVGDNSEVTDMTGKEVIDLASGRKEAGETATSNADKNSLLIPNMDGYLSMVTVLIIRGLSMAITSMAPCG
ncbi:hypothetical protein lerEdw1_010995 [Lerista edwardsae]|nr:hypothetical protein lerEdw1_010995 [Lerista edwardsae]